MEQLGCVTWAWVDGFRSHCSWQHVRNTLTAGPASLRISLCTYSFSSRRPVRFTSRSGLDFLFLLTPDSWELCENHTSNLLGFSTLSHPAICGVLIQEPKQWGACRNHTRNWLEILHSSYSVVLGTGWEVSIVELVSQHLLSAKLRNCMHVYVHFDGLIDGLLTMALNNAGEVSGDARYL